MSLTPDISLTLKPEFVVVVDKIYREICNLQPGTRVLIISDSRTPHHVVGIFMGMAMTMGAEVSVSENYQAPPPAVQPGYKWNPMVAAASREADLIVDLAVGYADFIVEAMQRGAQVITPGDGTGGVHIEDSLIRTMLNVDIHELRRESIYYADLFTQSNEIRMTSEEGTDFTLDIRNLEAFPSHEFLWDPEKKEKIFDWSALPPAAPGLILPKHTGNGIVAVDGFVLYSNTHEIPTAPIFFTIENGKIVHLEGEDRHLVSQLNHWLDSLSDDSGKYGPVHFNLGLNPNAKLNEHQEFEKIRGTAVLGIGDSSLMNQMFSSGAGLETVVSDVHWDVIVMRPTISLDGNIICKNGILPKFEK